MKLVDILAEKLLAWPDGAAIAVQDGDKELKFSEASDAYIDTGGDVWIRGGRLAFREDGRIDVLASDYGTAIVTSAQWQEARGALIKPEQTQWNGEGLPPAGIVCELRNVEAETEWSQATIAFASRNVIVWDWVDEPAINGLCTAYAHAVQVRPIRTPEQLAAEARESGARQICIDAMADQFDEPTESQMAVARRLYDKGYRIFEIVDEAKE